MRHNNRINHLGRTHSHRDAMLSNMTVSLIKHKRIFTTLAKAKELRKYVEPLITKSKEDTTHSRRIVFQNLKDKYAISELFNEVSKKIGDRPGGYTRIIKTGNRLGDNASMCFIELVDFNELMVKDKKATAKARTRRSRKKSDVATPAIKPDSLKAPSQVKAAVNEAPAKELPDEVITSEVPETIEVAEAGKVSEAEVQEAIEATEVSSLERDELNPPTLESTETSARETPAKEEAN